MPVHGTSGPKLRTGTRAVEYVVAFLCRSNTALETHLAGRRSYSVGRHTVSGLQCPAKPCGLRLTDANDSRNCESEQYGWQPSVSVVEAFWKMYRFPRWQMRRSCELRHVLMACATALQSTARPKHPTVYSCPRLSWYMYCPPPASATVLSPMRTVPSPRYPGGGIHRPHPEASEALRQLIRVTPGTHRWVKLTKTPSDRRTVVHMADPWTVLQTRSVV